MADTDAGLTALRAHFPPEKIGKLPRSGITLDYVGHADVTDRLLDADLRWTWEPVATDEDGLPLFVTDSAGRPVGLWIRLTVCGVTRLGYGSCPGTQTDAQKVLIGDALRNAAMRYGVALDLWAKGDRADPTRENASGPGGQQAPRQARGERAPSARQNALAEAKRELWQVWRELHGDDRDALNDRWAEDHDGAVLSEASAADIAAFAKRLRADAAKAERAEVKDGKARAESVPDDLWTS